MMEENGTKMMNIAQLANRWGCSYDTARRVTRQKGFPPAVYKNKWILRHVLRWENRDETPEGYEQVSAIADRILMLAQEGRQG